MFDEQTVSQYIHEQFTEEAAVYAARYQNVAYWKHLLQVARSNYVLSSPDPVVLDIGSGSGNTVLPLLDLYPSADIVASDLSVPLLTILKKQIADTYPNRECTLIQANAEALCFVEAQFDLVVGGAILHHLFVPEQAIRECFRVLRPGGVSVFFEPFELGNLALSLVLQQLMFAKSCLSSEREPIDEKVIRFFERLCDDYEVRKGTDKQLDIFKYIDDKWLFTKDYLLEAGRTAGFHDVLVFPINPDSKRDDMFSHQVMQLLTLGCQGAGELPVWALEMLRKLDRHFSPAIRNELIMEGCIIMKK